MGLSRSYVGLLYMIILIKVINTQECTYLLAHGLPFSQPIDIQGVYQLADELVNRRPDYRLITEPLLHVYFAWGYFEIAYEFQTIGFGQGGGESPYEVSSWSVQTLTGWVSSSTFKFECENSTDVFWRVEGLCEDSSLYIDDLVSEDSTSQSLCQTVCLNDPRCTTYSYSSKGCFPATDMCENLVSITEKAFTYTNQLVFRDQVGKAVYQSSVVEALSGYPDQAIDGNTDSHLLAGGSCIHTQPEWRPWWALDLGQVYVIRQAIITSRTDCCRESKAGTPLLRFCLRHVCDKGDRILGLSLGTSVQEDVVEALEELRSGNYSSLSSCLTVTSLPVRHREVLTCNPGVTGQLVVIHRTASRPDQTVILDVCEVEIRTEPATRFLPLNLEAPLSINAEQSISYCRDYFLGGEPLTASHLSRDSGVLEGLDPGDYWVNQAEPESWNAHKLSYLTGQIINIAVSGAVGTTCSASSSMVDNPCEAAIDDDYTTSWLTNNQGIGASITLQFNYTFLIYHVLIGQMPHVAGFENVTLTWSDTSTLPVTLTRAGGGEVSWDHIKLSTPVVSSSLDIAIDSVYGDGQYGLVELQVFGEHSDGLVVRSGECHSTLLDTVTGTLDVCQAECLNNVGCEAFTWYISTGECALMTGDCDNITDNADASTFIKTDELVSAVFISGAYCQDYSTLIRSVSDIYTLQDCIHACRIFLPCTAVDYSSSFCQLRSGTCVTGTGTGRYTVLLRESTWSREARYIGCFSKIAWLASTSLTVHTPDTCIQHCTTNNYNFAIIGFSQCYCSNVIDGDQVQGSSCTVACSTDRRFNCGGYAGVSAVYFAAMEPVSDCVYLTDDDVLPVSHWHIAESTCLWQRSQAVCQRDFEYCSSQPCRNGGSCNEEEYTYTCDCAPGFTGDHCHTDVNDCLGVQCVYGDCMDEVDTYSCICQPGYTGSLCQTEIDECESSPCLHGATCQDMVAAYTCGCHPGYEGLHCEMELDECSSGPCEHGGSCTDAVNNFTCHCWPGFDGHTCQTEIAECSSSPCLSGGSCLDLIDRYVCLCKSGFTGLHCETEVDECSSSPCVHGLCVDHVDAFSCTCHPGYHGFICEIEDDECESDPCRNEGSCQDQVDGYVCLCLPGFGGDLCEDNIGNPGLWVVWETWSPCSQPCGDGIRVRARDCDPFFPVLGDGHCSPGPASVFEQCQFTICPPVDGGWGAWYPVSTCSRTCGLGVQSMKRDCDTPRPSDGGLSCVGEEEDAVTRLCQVTDCPDSPFIKSCSAWSNWTTCSATCGRGQMSQTRRCWVTSADDVITNQTSADDALTSVQVKVSDCYQQPCMSDGQHCHECDVTITTDAMTSGGCENDVICPGHQPYCSYSLTVSDDSKMVVRKGCSDQQTCELWRRATDGSTCDHIKRLLPLSSNPSREQRLVYDVMRRWNDVIETSCSFCCEGELCNDAVLPSVVSLYVNTGVRTKMADLTLSVLSLLLIILK